MKPASPSMFLKAMRLRRQTRKEAKTGNEGKDKAMSVCLCQGEPRACQADSADVRNLLALLVGLASVRA